MTERSACIEFGPIFPGGQCGFLNLVSTFLTSVLDLDVTMDIGQHFSFSAYRSNLSLASQRAILMLFFYACYSTLYLPQGWLYTAICIGLPKSRLVPLQIVLNAATRLVAHIHRFSHICNFYNRTTLLASLSARIQIRCINYETLLGLASCYII